MGHSVFQTGRLDPALIDRCVQTMREFSEMMDDARVDGYHAVVTASARSAQNGDVLLRRVHEETGIRLDSVDGAEEARLVGLAVRQVMGVHKSVLMDLGGGSLELSELSAQGEDGFLVSLDIGTVRLLEAFLEPGQPVSARQDLLIRENLDRLLTPYRQDLRESHYEQLVGTGGNLVAVAKLAGVEGTALPTIDVAKAVALRDALSQIGAPERIEKYGLKADRADVIVPALYVIVAMAQIAGLDRIVCPGVGLKEGIVRELVDKHYRVWDYQKERDILCGAALQLGRRYHFDERHAQAVAGFSCQIFDATQSLHGLSAEDRGILRIAALLHDIGDFVHPSSHHKHSQYIIENSDLMGLEPDHRQLVALVARYHRRAAPALRHTAYAALSSELRDRVKSLSSILRIADALDRGHRGKVETLDVHLDDKTLNLGLTSHEDASLEIWTLERKASLFRDVFGVEINATTAVVPNAVASSGLVDHKTRHF